MQPQVCLCVRNDKAWAQQNDRAQRPCQTTWLSNGKVQHIWFVEITKKTDEKTVIYAAFHPFKGHVSWFPWVPLSRTKVLPFNSTGIVISKGGVILLFGTAT